MSNSPTPAVPSSASDDGLAPLGCDLIAARERLQQQRNRVRFGIWIETIGVVALMLIAYALPSLLIDRGLRLEWIYRVVLLVGFVAVVARVVRSRLIKPLDVPLSDEEMALAVERQSPELDQILISSLQFDREVGFESSSIESQAMKAAVVTSVRDRLQSIPFARAVDARRLWKFALGIFVAIQFFGGWAVIDSGSLCVWASRNVLLSNADWPRYTSMTFADGATEVRLPQGDALTVRVIADGVVPDQAFLDYVFTDGEAGSEPMSLTGENEFTWNMDAVLGDVDLTVQGGDSLPVAMSVKVVERPLVMDLAVHVTLPEYMERESYDVPPTEGDIRVSRGAKLTISANSQKDLQSAFVLFGNDEKASLVVGEDQRSFRGEFYPQQSGLLIVDVIDGDSLGAGSPSKLLLRVSEDQDPTIEMRLRGIGSSITYQARIPGALKVRDDFGIRTVDAMMRVTDDQAQSSSGVVTLLPEDPWVDANPLFSEQLLPNSLVYDAEASVDLATWNTVQNQVSTNNPIRPGMLFSLRYSAKDNFGPGDRHEGFGETMTFRVVTRDKLVEELRRRQIEQRMQLQQVADEEAVATLELTETVHPKAAGDQGKLARARFKAMARRQQALGRRVRFISEAYQRILWEYENNRLIESNKVRQMEAVITTPLNVLAKEDFPSTARLVTRFLRAADESVRSAAVEGYRDIKVRLDAILNEMEQAENLAALLEELRNVINLETDAIREVQKRLQELESSLFEPKKKKSVKPSASDPSKKPEKDKR